MLRNIFALLVAGCVCGATSAATAEDFSARAARQAYDWSGFYIGAHAGYGQQTGSTNFGPGNAFSEVYFNNGWVPQSLSTDTKGALGGTQIGANWQSGSFVYGVETDVSFTDISGSVNSNFTIVGLTFGTAASSKLDTLGTVRSRLGFTPWDRSLLYVTGGLAYGRAEISSSETFSNNVGRIICGPVGICASAASTKWLTGWTIGGGWEQAVAEHWSIKLEYLYYDLGSLSHRFSDGDASYINSTDFKGYVARAGVNYKF